MSHALSPEHAAEALRLVASIRHDLRSLTLHGPDGTDYAVPLAREDGRPGWLPLPGRQGVRVCHVPHPDGTPPLHAGFFDTAPGARYTGSRIDHSRLLTLHRGDLTCNGRRYGPGQSWWIAPDTRTSWHSETGAFGAMSYGVPNPFADFDDFTNTAQL